MKRLQRATEKLKQQRPASPLVRAIRRLVDAKGGEWSGYNTALLRVLEFMFTESQQPIPRWLRSPAGLIAALRRAADDLWAARVSVELYRSGKRRWVVLRCFSYWERLAKEQGKVLWVERVGCSNEFSLRQPD